MAADSGIITASLRELAEGLDEAVDEQTMDLEEMDLMATAELERLLGQAGAEATATIDAEPDDSFE